MILFPLFLFLFLSPTLTHTQTHTLDKILILSNLAFFKQIFQKGEGAPSDEQHM